jgi:hypothetical protein
VCYVDVQFAAHRIVGCNHTVADIEFMNSAQLERILDLIDSNIHAGLASARGEIIQYLTEHGDELAREIYDKGFGDIPTQVGAVRVSKEDLEAVPA